MCLIMVLGVCNKYVLTLTALGIDFVCRRQIMTTKFYPRTVRLKILIMAVDP